MTESSLNPAASLQQLIDQCLQLGATGADARIASSDGVSVSVREGALESIERAESQAVALRCFAGQRQAHVSGSDLSEDGLKLLAERCVAMAKAVPEDAYCGLALPEDLVTEHVALELDGDGDIDDEHLQKEALEAEAAALAVDGVRTVPDCGHGWSRTQHWLAASNGFSAHHTSSSSSIGLVALAEQDGRMERDYESRTSRFRDDRPRPEDIGRIAGERVISRLGARKVATQKAAVIYDRRVSAGLLGPLIGAIAGPAIARGVSFLKDRLGDQIFSSQINIIDDPFRRRGLGTRAFDGEGRRVAKRAIIEDGVLTEWLLNGPSARQLGLSPNGYASAGFGDPPGVTTSNVHLAPGETDRDGLMKQAGTGLLVTEMFGPSINPNTGDYSVGVSGMWFEDGVLAFPVSEVTIADSLPDMYRRLIPANDLELRGSRDAPSLLIEDMSIAGD